jgi:hypothetical protein
VQPKIPIAGPQMDGESSGVRKSATWATSSGWISSGTKSRPAGQSVNTGYSSPESYYVGFFHFRSTDFPSHSPKYSILSLKLLRKFYFGAWHIYCVYEKWDRRFFLFPRRGRNAPGEGQSLKPSVPSQSFFTGGRHGVPSLSRMDGQREILRTRVPFLGVAVCCLRRNSRLGYLEKPKPPQKTPAG